MGFDRIPGTDCSIHGTARSLDSRTGFYPPSAARASKSYSQDELTAEEQELLLDLSQALLDLVGIVDQTGISDLTNASISFSRGDHVGGWIGVIAMVPILGDLAKLPRISKHIITVKKIIEKAKKSSRFYEIIAPSLRKLSSILDKIDSLKGQVGDTARRLNEPIREFLGKAIKVVQKTSKTAMRSSHLTAFQSVAKKHGVFILLRNTNEACHKWIAKGFPSKPIEIKANTGSDGLVTYLWKDKNVIDNDLANVFASNHGVLRKDGEEFFLYFEDHATKEITKKKFQFSGDYTLADAKDGHVIHRGLNQPLTGDYDLLAVVDPKDYLKNQASIKLGDGPSKSNPFDEEIIHDLNNTMGEKRILHGTDERFKPIGSKSEDITVFFPDGVNVKPMHGQSEELLNLYEALKLGKQ
jgi:hypothetical protein